MWKLGGSIKNWQRRYFKLIGQTLEYYVTMDNPDKKQVSNLQSPTYPILSDRCLCARSCHSRR